MRRTAPIGTQKANPVRPADFRQPWTDVDATAQPPLLLQMMDAFNETAWLKGHKARALEALSAHSPGACLEVGCGTGEDARALAALLSPIGQVMGLDYSQTMTNEATRRASSGSLTVSFIQGDAYALPFENNTFDAAYSLLTFDILERPADALREMVRVTRPGGIVFVSASDHGTLAIDAPDRALTRALINFFCDSTCNGWIGRQLPALLMAAGLGHVSVKPDTVTLQSPDYAVARQVLLENMVAGARAASVISASQGEAWLALLDEAHRGNTFFASSTFFMVKGLKPA
jgi:ubiquinone/menaquinone biosynthesis C-methylase UbiE